MGVMAGWSVSIFCAVVFFWLGDLDSGSDSLYLAKYRRLLS